jgi:hypothetical protein
MEVIDYGLCQVINLMNVFRPQGHAYYPEIAAKVAVRYQFVRPPSLDDLTKEMVKFQVGKFNDMQINEFSIYNDGVIANGNCPTEALEEFLIDILAFSEQELKFKKILEYRTEFHFESIVTVKSETDLAAFIASPTERLIGNALEDSVRIPYRPSGIVMDCDPGTVIDARMRRKPARFFIERKVGFEFKDNIFICIAPLRTKDHLELLVALEAHGAKTD